MHFSNLARKRGLGTLLRALLLQLEPAVERTYGAADELMRSRYYPIMRKLIACDGASVGQLANAAGVSQPAITQTLQQMVEDGLIIIVPGEDRRSRIVTLSQRGWLMAERVEKVWGHVAAAADMLEAEIEHPLAAILERTLSALEQKDFAARIAEQEEAINETP